MIKMKKCLKIIILVLIFSFLISSQYSIFATDKDEEATIDTSITGDSFTKALNPDGISGTAEQLSNPFVKFIHQVVNPILGFIQIIGGILTVVSIALFGFGMLLTGNEHLSGELGLRMMGGPHGGGGPEAKLELLNFGRRLLIGAVLLFCSASIVKFVFYVFNIYEEIYKKVGY